MTTGGCCLLGKLFLEGKEQCGPGHVRKLKANFQVAQRTSGFVCSRNSFEAKGKRGRGGLCNNKKEAAAAWTMVVWSRQLGSTRLPGTVECGHLSILVPGSGFLLGQRLQNTLVAPPSSKILLYLPPGWFKMVIGQH